MLTDDLGLPVAVFLGPKGEGSEGYLSSVNCNQDRAK